MTKQTEDGVPLIAIITWILAGLMGAAFMGAVVIAWIVYMSVAWPYYLMRGIARWD